MDNDLSGSAGVGADGMIDPIAARRAAAGNLEAMAQQRERLEDQVATTAQELERLRQRREGLESQKRSLEEMRKHQDDYLDEKKDMTQRVHQSLVLLEKEEVRVAQLTDLYADSRKQFERMRERLDAMEEGAWGEDAFAEELSRALDQLKATRLDFNKSLARLDALGWSPETALAEQEEDEGSIVEDRRFADWVFIGFAIGLPIAILLGVTSVLVYFSLTDWLAQS